MTTLIVMLGAGVGAAARWFVDRGVSKRWQAQLPMGTLIINVLGSLTLGAVLAAHAHLGLRGEVAALLGAGFCGGFTTFSTFAYEVVELGKRREAGAAAAYVGLSVTLSLAAAFAGWTAISALA